ncbi:MAG: UvrD-helicase domain-containing protein [Oligoflexales bacterium]|nr:UvrD-helicase domain-containing protein [Oligoflexales bacterium]
MIKQATSLELCKAYDPYKSFVVRASAGSGKTFQLSRRFLFLVAAGADPSKILTITFTNKAAAEMQERILASALKLKIDAKFAAELDDEIAFFYRDALSKNGPQFNYKKPLKFREVSDIILHSAQRLTISTIDSLFWSWVQRFPFEAQLFDLDQLPQKQFQLILGADLNERNNESWNQFIVESFRDPESFLAMSMQKMIEEFGVEKIARIVQTLSRFDTFIWQREQYGTAFCPHKDLESEFPEFTTEEKLLDSIKDNFERLFATTKKQDEFLAAFDSGLIALRASGFLTQQWKVSGTFIKQAKRILMAADVDQIEVTLRKYIDQKAIEKLDSEGSLYFALYRAWQQSKRQAKLQKVEIEFNDLTQAAFRIFCSEQGLGAKYSILSSIEHILLDEFQDTSRLQWQVFKSLLDELLASSESIYNRSGLYSSLFVVGDTKQSIYGFREADPEVLNEVAECFSDYNVQTLNLDTSYRSCQAIVDHINCFYTKFPIEGFHTHRTTETLESVCGGVFLFDPFSDDERLNLDAREKEGKTIASLIKQILAMPKKFPVFEKDRLAYRAVELRDICLLYRDATHSVIYQRELEKLGINCQRHEERGFFKRIEIADMMQLMQWLALPHDLNALSTILRSPILRLSDKELFEFLGKVGGFKELNLLQRVSAAELNSDLKNLLDIQAKVQSEIPSQILLDIIKKLNILGNYCEELGRDEGGLAVENILQFVELCSKLEQNGSRDIFSLNRQISKLASEDSVGGVQTSSSAVTLMTMHKSKGAEYPFVFLVDINQKRPLRDRYWLRLKNEEEVHSIYYVGKKDEWPLENEKFNSRVEELKRQIQSEEDRLAYVAMTRARQYLFLSGLEGLGANDKIDEAAELEEVEKGDTTLFERTQSLFADVVTSNFEISCDEYTHSCKHIYASSPDVDIDFDRDKMKNNLPLDLRKNGKEITLQKNLYVPAQVYIKNPHDIESVTQDEELEANFMHHESIPAQLYAREIGLFVHEGLEFWMAGRKFNTILSWKKFHVKASDEKAAEYWVAYKEGLKQINAIIADKVLQEVLSKYPIRLPEISICSLQENSLISGKIDLFLRDPGKECLVLDFKSLRLSLDQKNKSVLDKIVKEAGYAYQLNAYAKQLEEIYPTEPINRAIYFTSIQYLLIL